MFENGIGIHSLDLSPFIKYFCARSCGWLQLDRTAAIPVFKECNAFPAVWTHQQWTKWQPSVPGTAPTRTMHNRVIEYDDAKYWLLSLILDMRTSERQKICAQGLRMLWWYFLEGWGGWQVQKVRSPALPTPGWSSPVDPLSLRHGVFYF